MSAVSVPPLSGHGFSLRAPIAADRAAYQLLGRNPEIVNSFGGDTPLDLAISDDDASAWYKTATATPHLWVIEVAGRFAGTARLHSLDAHDRRATYAIGILDPANLGLGIGTKATRLVLDYAFGEMRMHRVGLRVLATNLRAIRCYKKCGFVVEGRERESGLVDGVRVDDIIMGLIRPDWERLTLSAEGRHGERTR